MYRDLLKSFYNYFLLPNMEYNCYSLLEFFNQRQLVAVIRTSKFKDHYVD